jgi:hypothetical protein
MYFSRAGFFCALHSEMNRRKAILNMMFEFATFLWQTILDVIECDGGDRHDD